MPARTASGKPEALEETCGGQPAQAGADDRDAHSWVDVTIRGQREMMTSIGVGSNPEHGLWRCGQLESTAITAVSARSST